MSYPAMNQDVILEIFSYCPASAIEKLRFLNKDYYKRMSESSFINLNLLRTNSVIGVFLQYQRYPSTFNSSFVLAGDGEVSLDFLPIQKIKIEACDPSHGILLCSDSLYFGKTSYVVCKPTTRQYRTIPTPETGYSTLESNFQSIVSGLTVIRANPLKYKIVKISMQDKKFTVVCEVFDSDMFAWKRLDDVILPKGEYLQISSVLVSNNRFLHWLTTSNKNVLRFCMKTETWSLIPLPNDLLYSSSLVLTNYEGKIGIIRWKPKSGGELKGAWVLDCTFGKSWVNLKEEKCIVEEDKLVKPVWLHSHPSNDVIMMAGFDWVGLYNMKTNNSMIPQRFKVSLPYSFDYTSSSVNYFPFRSDYEKLDFNEDDVENSNDKS